MQAMSLGGCCPTIEGQVCSSPCSAFFPPAEAQLPTSSRFEEVEGDSSPIKVRLSSQNCRHPSRYEHSRSNSHRKRRRRKKKERRFRIGVGKGLHTMEAATERLRISPARRRAKGRIRSILLSHFGLARLLSNISSYRIACTMRRRIQSRLRNRLRGRIRRARRSAHQITSQRRGRTKGSIPKNWNEPAVGAVFFPEDAVEGVGKQTLKVSPRLEHARDAPTVDAIATNRERTNDAQTGKRTTSRHFSRSRTSSGEQVEAKRPRPSNSRSGNGKPVTELFPAAVSENPNRNSNVYKSAAGECIPKAYSASESEPPASMKARIKSLVRLIVATIVGGVCAYCLLKIVPPLPLRQQEPEQQTNIDKKKSVPSIVGQHGVCDDVIKEGITSVTKTVSLRDRWGGHSAGISCRDRTVKDSEETNAEEREHVIRTRRTGERSALQTRGGAKRKKLFPNSVASDFISDPFSGTRVSKKQSLTHSPSWDPAGGTHLVLGNKTLWSSIWGLVLMVVGAVWGGHGSSAVYGSSYGLAELAISGNYNSRDILRIAAGNSAPQVSKVGSRSLLAGSKRSYMVLTSGNGHFFVRAERPVTVVPPSPLPYTWDCTQVGFCEDWRKVCSNTPEELVEYVYDKTTGNWYCAEKRFAHFNNPDYMLYDPNAEGNRNRDCLLTSKGDGICDSPNNHEGNQCEFDGGDCCKSTCEWNCRNPLNPNYVERPGTDDDDEGGGGGGGGGSPEETSCSGWCGERGFECYDDNYTNMTAHFWCAAGQGEIQTMSNCHASQWQVARALQECIITEASHGNEYLASPLCGNRSETCAQVSRKVITVLVTVSSGNKFLGNFDVCNP